VNLFLFPLGVLASLTTWLGARGLDQLWSAHAGTRAALVATLPISTALHSAWLLGVLFERRAALVLSGWLLCTRLTGLGLMASGFSSSAHATALVLESFMWLVARAVRPPTPMPTHLARWHEWRDAISEELRSTSGWLPWCRWCWQRLLHGTPRPGESERARAPSWKPAETDSEVPRDPGPSCPPRAGKLACTHGELSELHGGDEAHAASAQASAVDPTAAIREYEATLARLLTESFRTARRWPATTEETGHAADT
jgi:hypothetical protein